jgi:hypothetical protein
MLAPHDILLGLLVVALLVVIFYTRFYKPTESFRVERPFHSGLQPNWSPYGAPPASQNPSLDHADRIAHAERAVWSPAGPAVAGHVAPGETAHSGGATYDYGAVLTEQVADARMADNHRKFVKELKPFTGAGGRMRDNHEEAFSQSAIPWVGLRRPQAVPQYNPTQLTEADHTTYADNKKFNFKG